MNGNSTSVKKLDLTVFRRNMKPRHTGNELGFFRALMNAKELEKEDDHAGIGCNIGYLISW